MSLKLFQDIVKYVDFYGVKVGINFKNQQVHRTECGSIISLIIIFIFLLGCYSYVIELAQKQKPIVISNERFVKNPERMNFDQQHQTIVMGIRDSKGKLISDPSILQVSSKLITMQKQLNPNTHQYDSVTSTIPLRLRHCNENDVIIESVKRYFHSLELNQLYCFDGNQEVYIQGNQSSDIFSRVEVYFKQCKNQQGQSPCALQGQIDTQLESSTFNVYLIDKLVDPTEYTNPFQYDGINLSSFTSSKQSKEYTAFFSNYYIQSDVGFVQETIEEKRDFILSSNQEQITYEDPTIITKFVIQPMKNRENIIYRRYMKIGDFLAQLGAILKILVIGGFIITYPFTKFHLHKEIVNSIYEFDFERYNRLSEVKDNDIEQQQIQKSVKRPTLTKLMSNEQMADINHQNNYNNNPPSAKSTTFQQKFNHQLNERLRRVSFQLSNGEQKEKSDYYTICNTNQDNESQVQQGKQEFINRFYDRNNEVSKGSDHRKMSNSQSIKDNSGFPSRRFSQFAQQQDQSSGNNINPKDSKPIICDIQQAFRLEQAIRNWAKEFIKPFKKVLTFNISEYISQIFYPFSNEMKEKKELVNEGIGYLQQRLDVEYIMHKFQEFDKLKQIVLNEDQVRLFDLIPKPVIKQNINKNKKSNLFYYCCEKSYEEKLSDAQLSLYNLLNKEKKQQRDLKILELLDFRIFEIFQNMNNNENRGSPSKAQIPKQVLRQRSGSYQNTLFNQITEQDQDQYTNQFKIIINSPTKPTLTAQLDQIKQENEKNSYDDDNSGLEEQDLTFQRNHSLQMKYHKNSYNI